jgi:hypothetical protein
MVDFDLETKTDGEAIAIFRDLLRKKDPYILVTRNGPTFLALARRFGLVPPSGQERLFQKGLPPGQVLEVVTRWAQFLAGITDLAGGREFIATYGLSRDLSPDDGLDCPPPPRRRRLLRRKPGSNTHEMA